MFDVASGACGPVMKLTSWQCEMLTLTLSNSRGGQFSMMYDLKKVAFLNGGRTVMTKAMFPSGLYNTLTLRSGADSEVQQLIIYNLTK